MKRITNNSELMWEYLLNNTTAGHWLVRARVEELMQMAEFEETPIAKLKGEQ